MTATNIKCPSGHSNSATQKFCGECGASLVGVCPEGHQNPEGQRYCGECGAPVSQSGTASGIPSLVTDAGRETEPQTATFSGLYDPNEQPDPVAISDAGAEPGQGAAHDEATIRLGDEFEVADGISATVVKVESDTVWLNLTKGQSSYGISKFPRRDVEKFKADRTIVIAAQSVPAIGHHPQHGLSDGDPAPVPLAGSSGGIQAWWARLQTEGKVAIAGAATLLMLVLVVTVATFGGSGRDKESYTWGYQKGTSGFTQDWAKGTSDGVKKTCQDTVDYWIDLMKKKDIDRGDAVEGCMDAVNARPLGPG